MGRKAGTPVSVTFELTSRCNFNCRMCYIHDCSATAAGELSASDWLNIGKQAADAGAVFVLLTGGEPLLRRDFAEIYTGLKKLGLMISINTNGFLLSGEIAELFEKNPPMRINVSLYGDSRETYLEQCGVDAFETVVANIRRMKAAGVQMKLNICFTPQNAGRFEQLSKLADELELHCQAAVYMYPPVRRAGGETPFSRLSATEAAKLRIKWDLLRGKDDKIRSAADYFAKLQLRECEDSGLPGEGVRCRAGHTSYWIGANGDMLMCGMIPKPCGNVMESGFESCRRKAHDFMQTVSMPAKCTACTLRPVCCVCPAACFAETGDFTKAPPYLCEMSEKIRQTVLEKASEGKSNETE